MKKLLKKTNLHQRVFYRFPRLTIKAPGKNDTWAVDLMDWNSADLSNSGYLLNAVDVFTRYAQSMKLTEKTSDAIQIGLEGLFVKFNAKPKKIWSDLEPGLDALKPWLSTQRIEVYHTNNSYMGAGSHSVSIVERFNQEMNKYIFQYHTDYVANWKQAMTNAVNNFIPIYNNREHSTINMSPHQAYHGDDDVQVKLDDNQEERADKKRKGHTDKLKIGDEVYLQRHKQLIKGKKLTKYVPEVEVVSAVIQTNPITYKLKSKGETKYYRQQMVRKEEMPNVETVMMTEEDFTSF